MLFDLSDNQRYELEHDGEEANGYVHRDGQFWVEIADDLCEKIQATYIKVPVKTKVAENEEDALAFVCLTQDASSLYDIQQRMADPDITAASFGTHTGDYAPLFIRYDQPSFRSGGQWYRVHPRDPKTGRIAGSSGL